MAHTEWSTFLSVPESPGGSGHCFKLGPAIGELVAGAIIGKPVSYASVETFSLARFAEGRELGSSYGGNRA